MSTIPNFTHKRVVSGVGRLGSTIAIVGEAPTTQEEFEQEPFVGTAGRLLRNLFFRAGVLWDDCYVTYVVKEKPTNGDIENFIKFTKKGAEHRGTYDNYVELLKEELKEVKPNVVFAVGNVALYALTGETGVTQWRGSILESTLIPGLKVIPTIHPAAAQKQYMYNYYIFHDVQKLKHEADSPLIKLNEFQLYTDPTYTDILHYLEQCKSSNLLAFDLEVGGYKHGLSEVSCISFSKDPETAMSIPFVKGGKPRWSPENEMELWNLIAELLEDPNLKKVAQNRFFDGQMVFRRYGIVVKNCEDTMIAQAILRPDFPKGLDFITSMYTNIGYYKADGKEFFGGRGNEESFWIYNAKDSIACTQSFPVLERELKKANQWETYQKQNELVEVLIFMSEFGIKLDTEGLKRASSEAQVRLDELEALFKSLANRDINMRSPVQLKEYFYGKKKDGGLGITPYKDDKGNPTTDEGALQRMARPLSTRPAVPEAIILLEHRKLSKLRGTYYEMNYDDDGRMRSSLNPVGTRYGRLSSSENIFGTGTNMQNQPSSMKKYFLVDDGYIGYEIDLSQAENRLVAYIAPEPKLIDAFENKIDIHSRTASYIFNKDEKLISKEKASAPQFGNGEHDERFWGKKANHAFNYGQSSNAFAQQMLITLGEAQTIFHAYHNAYPGIAKYHNMIKQMLERNRTLTNLFGRSYTFLGRWDYQLYLEAYAFIPQSTIADIINRWGLLPLYEVPEVVQVNQIHDSMVFQINKEVPLERHAEILLGLRDSLTQDLTWNGRKFSIPCDMKVMTKSLGEGREVKLAKTLTQTELVAILAEEVSKGDVNE